MQIYESFNICLSPIQKTGKIQVNYIQVLVTTPNMEKPQKVFSFLFIFLKKIVAFPWVETSTGPGGFMICVFLVYDRNSRKAQPKVVLWRNRESNLRPLVY